MSGPHDPVDGGEDASLERRAQHDGKACHLPRVTRVGSRAARPQYLPPLRRERRGGASIQQNGESAPAQKQPVQRVGQLGELLVAQLFLRQDDAK
ncbi:hypothetical protein [Sorangium cellulosum]|uniref:hypothetical protein n=1 Tax=Sorangium cellulosum TaxID=56 RepID=UPI0012DB6DD9|nr:hypothetical protein [Sorangium cellulosum]